MTERFNGVYNLTAPTIMAHPNLFVAKAFGTKGKETGEPKYSANLVFASDHPDLPKMKAMAIACAKAQWPGVDLKGLVFPFGSGTKAADKRAEERKKAGKEPDGEYQRGCAVIAARSKYEPKLAVIKGGQLVDYEGDARKAVAKDFFFGAEVLAQINFVAYKGVGRNPDGVTAYLNMIVATGRGKRIAGGGQSASEVFKGYVGQTTTEDPTGGDEGQAGIPDQF